MNWNRLGCCALLLLAPLPALARGVHVNLIDYPSDEAGWDRAFALEDAVAGEFAAWCADTLCEGDYSNYRVMEFRCAVLAHRGTVQRCVWWWPPASWRLSPTRDTCGSTTGAGSVRSKCSPGCPSTRSTPPWKRRVA